MGDRKPQLLG